MRCENEAGCVSAAGPIPPRGSMGGGGGGDYIGGGGGHVHVVWGREIELAGSEQVVKRNKEGGLECVSWMRGRGLVGAGEGVGLGMRHVAGRTFRGKLPSAGDSGVAQSASELKHEKQRRSIAIYVLASAELGSSLFVDQSEAIIVNHANCGEGARRRKGDLSSQS